MGFMFDISSSRYLWILTGILICIPQIEPVDYPFDDDSQWLGKGRTSPDKNIADFLMANEFELVINLPLRSGGSRRVSSFMTQGYKTRRMAIDHSVPLITDVKCAKMFVQVTYSVHNVFWGDSQLDH